MKKRRRRRPLQHPGVVPPVTHAPNDLWAADFKGQFRTGDRIYCYPLTVTDQHTRYLLACHGLLSTRGTGVRPVFDRLFREYGLPRAMRTDNGVPFASTSLHGLTPLNVWWLRLGIQHQRILPAHPQQVPLSSPAHAQDPETKRHSAAARQPRDPAARLPPISPAGTTTSGLTSFSAAGHQARAIAPRPARTPACCPRSSTPTTSW